MITYFRYAVRGRWLVFGPIFFGIAGRTPLNSTRPVALGAV